MKDPKEREGERGREGRGQRGEGGGGGRERGERESAVIVYHSSLEQKLRITLTCLVLLIVLAFWESDGE